MKVLKVLLKEEIMGLMMARRRQQAGWSADKKARFEAEQSALEKQERREEARKVIEKIIESEGVELKDAPEASTGVTETLDGVEIQEASLDGEDALEPAPSEEVSKKKSKRKGK